MVHRLLWLVALLSLTASADVPGEGSRMKLYLTSAGINVLDELIPLLPFQPSGHTVCYITTAGNLEGSPHWMDDEIAAIEKTGLDVRRIDLARLSASAMADKFQGCDVIWVGGGNTYYLLQEVRRSGFDDFVVEKSPTAFPTLAQVRDPRYLHPILNALNTRRSIQT